MVSPETPKEAQIQRVTLGFSFCEPVLVFRCGLRHTSAMKKPSNAQKNAAYPVTSEYTTWVAACEAAFPGCTFSAYQANHRFATPKARGVNDASGGHFWLNLNRGVVRNSDGEEIL